MTLFPAGHSLEGSIPTGAQVVTFSIEKFHGLLSKDSRQVASNSGAEWKGLNIITSV